jgi:hypothetical protein
MGCDNDEQGERPADERSGRKLLGERRVLCPWIRPCKKIR